MIVLIITVTTKGYSPTDTYSVCDDRRKSFPDMEAAREWLREEYGTCKRTKMFRDVKGVSQQVGWIYGYRNFDDWEKWLQQDWVEVVEQHPVDESELRGR